MQFLAIVSLALAGLASAATVPEVNKRASTPPGCANAYYNDGSDGSTGGWGCAGSTTWGDCTSYYWKESPPFWSVSRMILCPVCVRQILTASLSISATKHPISPAMDIWAPAGCLVLTHPSAISPFLKRT
ncbi:hypothetical protein N8I77_006105 [Diaporthe amygdali]|uniref:Uncharacterized protein n=1 Tax=Phomopsis amygdali TaxID=1214568 RepID=A0AAD9W3G5_PHOAM|nr:hypothetical protein N8I77_006105 [Diaporthe amygdali]